MNEAIHELGEALAREADAAMLGVLSTYLRMRVTVDKLRHLGLEGRLERRVVRDSGLEVFCVDGVEVFELHPVELAVSTEHGSVQMVATRKYRVLV